jgi:hypothetical protein
VRGTLFHLPSVISIVDTLTGRPVLVAGDGRFSLTYALSVGLNRLVIRAVNQAGNATERTLTVYYSGGTPPTTVTTTPFPGPGLLLIASAILIVVLVGVFLKL